MDLRWLVFLFLGIFLLLLFFPRSLAKPIKWAGYACLQLVVGGLMLFFFNIVGHLFSFHLPINPVTAAVSGFLGLPGIAVLVVIKLFIV
ncbi:sigma-K factor-processing regulator BofA [Bacillaceae bacterium]